MTERLGLAYLAGLFDADGMIRPTVSKPRRPAARVQIAMCAYDLLVSIQKHWGGYLTCRKAGPGYFSGRARNYDYWSWRLYDQRQVKDFLRAILPYLRVKRRQAELGLLLCDVTLLSKGRGGHRFRPRHKAADSLDYLRRVIKRGMDIAMEKSYA